MTNWEHHLGLAAEYGSNVKCGSHYFTQIMTIPHKSLMPTSPHL